MLFEEDDYKTKTVKVLEGDLNSISDLFNLELKEENDYLFFDLNLSSLDLETLYNDALSTFEKSEDGEYSIQHSDLLDIKNIIKDAILEEYLYISFYEEV